MLMRNEACERLLVDNMEFRSIPSTGQVFAVGRVARAVNCGLIGFRIAQLSKGEVDQAAAFGLDYLVKPYAASLTSSTARIPLLAYETGNGEVVLLDGRQRAAKAFEVMESVTACVVSENDADRWGLHPCAREVIRLKLSTVHQRWWNVLLQHVRAFFSPSLSIPVLIELQRTAEANDDPLLKTLVRRLLRLFDLLTGYWLLTATRAHPVVFLRQRRRVRLTDKRILQVGHLSSGKKPRDSWQETRIISGYAFAALELVTIEELLNEKGLPPYRYEASLRLPPTIGDQSHDDRVATLDGYLRAHWRDIGLISDERPGHPRNRLLARLSKTRRDLYPAFLTISRNAAAIIAEQSDLKSVRELRAHYRILVESLEQDGGDQAATERRDEAVYKFRVLCKALVRMRHSRSARIALLEMESSGQRLTNADVVGVARWDLDRINCLVDFQQMIVFTWLTGVVATAIWPIHLELNPLFEAWAFAHHLHHHRQGRHDRALHPSMTALEALVQRHEADQSGEVDEHTAAWQVVFAALDQLDCPAARRRAFLMAGDALQAVDDFDREHQAPLTIVY